MFNYSRFYTLLLAVFIMSTLACGGGGSHGTLRPVDR